MTNKVNKIMMLDCTLRDGGYLNDWDFGESTINGILTKMPATNIEAVEVGFIKREKYIRGRTVFSNTDDIKEVLTQKNDRLLYGAMIDMRNPVPLSAISKRDEKGVDFLRLMIKKDKIIESTKYALELKNKGYIVYMQPVEANQYTENEFISMLKTFNSIKPSGIYIVDSFGILKFKEFLNLAKIADRVVSPEIMLGYHAHNNLQQAFANASAFVDLDTERTLSIDASQFGMGKGAGNLNMELFSQHLNEDYGKNYDVKPMLEIIDSYIKPIYLNHNWGYSIPYFLSATYECNLNYVTYFESKNPSSLSAYDDYLKLVPSEKKSAYSPDVAESIYQEYLRLK